MPICEPPIRKTPMCEPLSSQSQSQSGWKQLLKMLCPFWQHKQRRCVSAVNMQPANVQTSLHGLTNRTALGKTAPNQECRTRYGLRYAAGGEMVGGIESAKSVAVLGVGRDLIGGPTDPSRLAQLSYGNEAVGKSSDGAGCGRCCINTVAGLVMPDEIQLAATARDQCYEMHVRRLQLSKEAQQSLS